MYKNSMQVIHNARDDIWKKKFAGVISRGLKYTSLKSLLTKRDKLLTLMNRRLQDICIPMHVDKFTVKALPCAHYNYIINFLSFFSTL